VARNAPRGHALQDSSTNPVNTATPTPTPTEAKLKALPRATTSVGSARSPRRNPPVAIHSTAVNAATAPPANRNSSHGTGEPR
jgi:hypothetical protein